MKDATVKEIREALTSHTALTKGEITSVMNQLDKGIYLADEDSARIAREIRKTFPRINKGEQTIKLHKLYSFLNNAMRPH